MFRHSERGATLVATAVVVTTLFGIGVLANDAARAWETYALLRRAVDSAAVAGASGLTTSPKEAWDRAEEYMSLNPIGGQSFELKPQDFVVGNWDSRERLFTPGGVPADSVRVTARVGAELSFARLFGTEGVPMETEAVATIQQFYDVVFIVDRTNSTEDGALTASNGIVEGLLDRFADDGRSHQAGVLYFHSVVDPYSTMGTPLTPYLADVRGRLTNVPDGNWQDNSNSSRALRAGLEELTSARATGTAHVAVLISSGDTNRPAGEGRAKEEARKAALALKDAGIRLHTITMTTGEPNPDPDLMAELASITGGHPFPESASLDEVYATITTAHDKVNSRLVK